MGPGARIARGGAAALIALGVAIGALSGAARASIASEAALSSDETARLMHGAAISRPQTLEKDDARYVGGLGYVIVDTSSDALAKILTDVDAYRAILPHTKSARLVGQDHGDELVELTQGNALFDATFTVRLRREGRSVRFWVDRSKPHGIDDAWGYFKWEPLAQVKSKTPRCLLSYGVLVDVGDGIVRDLFEEKIRAVVLTVPSRVREYVDRLRASP